MRRSILLAVAGTAGSLVAFHGQGAFSSNLALQFLVALAVGLGVLILDAGGWKLVIAAVVVGARFQMPVARSAARIVSYVLMAATVVVVLFLLAALLDRIVPRAA